MSQESVVYGCIKDAFGRSGEQSRREANRFAMLKLPRAEDWSYLSQEMFALPGTEQERILDFNDSGFHSAGDSYQTEVIHFGASYQAIEYEWKAWLGAFEKLLNDMYWVSAIVHLETELSGVHTFTWEATSNEHSPGMPLDPSSRQWTHELF